MYFIFIIKNFSKHIYVPDGLGTMRVKRKTETKVEERILEKG